MPLLDYAFMAPLSYLEVAWDIEAVKIPLSVAIGDEYMTMNSTAVKQMKEILDAKVGDFEVVIMSGEKHGFAIMAHSEDGRRCSV